MDLITGLGAVKEILTSFGGTPDSGEPWAADEASFERHFGATYTFFREVLEHLSPEQEERFEKTMQINPEAAVLWILSMDEI
jgi:hypothetical protein